MNLGRLRISDWIDLMMAQTGQEIARPTVYQPGLKKNQIWHIYSNLPSPSCFASLPPVFCAGCPPYVSPSVTAKCLYLSMNV
ncbi:hypothetical protein J4Q44_G00238260 [Coregonus suidteri]|uniref:Uncharacterized protein n=1 Tax=Coregonus suidteri TaxID=861788 RepID=A0AAN8QMS6_9TELE